MLILSALRRIQDGFQRFFSTKNAFFPPPRRSEMEVFGRIGRIFGIGRGKADGKIAGETDIELLLYFSLEPQTHHRIRKEQTLFSGNDEVAFQQHFLHLGNIRLGSEIIFCHYLL